MKKEIEKEISKISPGFPIRKPEVKKSLPDGYFDDFQEHVMKRVKREGLQDNKKRVSMHRIIRGMAAVLLIGICGWVIIHLSQPTSLHETSLELTKEDAFAYVLEHPFEMELIIHEMEELVDMTSLFSESENYEIDSNLLDVLLEQMSQTDFDDFL